MESGSGQGILKVGWGVGLKLLRGWFGQIQEVILRIGLELGYGNWGFDQFIYVLAKLKINLSNCIAIGANLISIIVKYNRWTKSNQNSIRINTLFNPELLDSIKLNKYFSKQIIFKNKLYLNQNLIIYIYFPNNP